MSHSVIVLRPRQTEITGLISRRTGRRSVKRTRLADEDTQAAAKARGYCSFAIDYNKRGLDALLVRISESQEPLSLFQSISFSLLASIMKALMLVNMD